MKKIYTLFLSVCSLFVVAQDGAPAAPYYNGFNFTLTGNALKNALASKISSTHTKELSYTPGIWNALKITDEDPNNSNNVLLLYGYTSSNRSRNKNQQCGGGNCNNTWNREHTYAQALGTPALGSTGPGADAHHLRACDYTLNENRGNKKFGAGSGTAQTVGANWYPGDEWKGDVARMMMYMYLRYGNQCLPKNVANGTPVPTDTNMIQLLLQWNAEDPVSEYEDQRNTYLEKTSNAYGQGNRNPFIDNPYLATLIWGGPAAQDRWGIMSVTDMDIFESQLAIYPNPAVNNEITVYSEIELNEVQVININGQTIQYIKNPPVKNTEYKIENLPQGFYIIKLSSENNTTSRKVIVN